MTKEQVIAMAREAVIYQPEMAYCIAGKNQLKRFATLVGNTKLEEAAQVCEAQLETGAHIRCAQAIRKLKEPTT